MKTPSISYGTIFVTLQAIALLGGVSEAQQRKSRDELVQEDRATVASDDAWIYNDLPRAVALGRETGKPLLVVFRCIPCEACAQLDASIVERDPHVRSLMQQYVCLRIVHANGLDLQLFQYDYDQSFAAFIMNADKTIYGRYGTRSDQIKSDDDVSLAGFARLLEAGLQLHANYPQNQNVFANKQTQVAPPVAAPEQFPRLQRYASKLDYDGKVAQSCIHCHQVGESLRHVLRDESQPIPSKVLFPYPHPKILGLIMDRQQMATLGAVTKDSIAEQEGLQAGDTIDSIDGQPILSIADLQWVLQHTEDQADLHVIYSRDGQSRNTTLSLRPGWREQGDISWRATSWDLRRMLMGGLLTEDASAELRSQHKIDDNACALLVKHVGQYGEHAHAKEQGFLKDDLILAVDGQTSRIRETDLFAKLVNRPIGTEITFTVLRNEARHEMKLKLRR